MSERAIDLLADAYEEVWCLSEEARADKKDNEAERWERVAKQIGLAQDLALDTQAACATVVT